ncbi:MAG TPA: cysteine desulfurase family protein [Planctomycetota bacterium]|nr:cysteine desulfurase family protein [Planctomycetota bacterium]
MPIYLDWNAATPPDPRVLEAYERALRDGWANPSSPHAAGRAVRALVEDARDEVARLAGVEPASVTFVSSGTEALNLVARGVPTRGAHVLASAVEHKALLEPLEDAGVALEKIPVDAEGRVSADIIKRNRRPDTALVCVLAAQNETGVLQPIDELHATTKGVPLLVDAAQAVGRIERDWSRGWDYLVLSAHKMRAPRGAAALIRRKGVAPPRPLLRGGGQELGRRAGTEDVAAIVGLGVACKIARERAALEPELARRRDRFEAALLAAVPGAKIAGHGAPRLPQTVALLVPGARSEDLLAALDLEGVRASAGSACSSGALEPSHVLAAMGVEPALARSVVRFSFGETTSEAELERAVTILGEVARRFAQSRGTR